MQVTRSSAFFSATVLCASLAAAQSTSTPATGQTSPKAPAAFVGCLEQSERTATTPETERGAFVLSTPTPSANAPVKGTPDDPASNARATIPSLDAGDTGRAESKVAGMYVLEGPKEEFTKHIGHKVEVTGVLKPAETTAADRPPAAGAPVASSVPHLQVMAIKMVSASCSGN